MKLIKKLNCLITTTFIITTLVGCGNATTEITKTETQKTDIAKIETPSTSTPAEEEKKEVKEPFEFWLPIHSQTSQSITDHNDHPAIVRIEEKTGVHVEYINPPVGQEDTQMNLLLATGDDMPDLFRFNLVTKYKGGVDGAISDGVILDATELIEQYAPNFMARINADPEMRRGAYTDSGAIAYFGSTLPDSEMQGLPFHGPLVNKTLLDKTGLDIPVTIADWEEMLAAFKDMGVKIPFSFGSNNNFDSSSDVFASAYGVPMGAKFMNQDGIVKFGPMESGYKEFITLFAKWYENGWLDADFLSKKQAKDIRPDFDGGFMGAALLHINSVISAPTVSVGQGNEENVAIPVPYPKVNESDTIHFRNYITCFQQTPTYISANAENPEEIVKWMDFFYSPEGIEEISWGVKGDDRFEDTYYIDENGENQFTEFIMNNPEGFTSDQCQRRYLFRDNCVVYDWENQLLSYSDERQQAGWKVWGDSADYDWVMPSTITLTIDENTEYSKLMSDITNYVNEMSAKFIMGIEPLENYDNFTTTLQSMNIERVIEIQQAALDRYLAR